MNIPIVGISSFGGAGGGDYLSANFVMSDSGRGLPATAHNSPAFINAIIVGICVRGNASLRINLLPYELEANSIVILLPGTMLESRTENVSSDFLLKFIVFSLDFVNSVEISDLFTRLKRYPVVCVAPGDMAVLLSLYKGILEKYLHKENPYRTEVVRFTLLAAIYDLYSILERNFSPAAGQGTNEDIEFQIKFFDLLYANYREHHKLQFYAQRLFVTSKYLSSKIKLQTNKSASEWINEFIALEAMFMLRSTGLTAQEIAFKLNFYDASTFGKFFRKQTGLTPKKYREG